MMNIGPEKIVIRFKRIILQCITHLGQAGLDDEFHVWFVVVSFWRPIQKILYFFPANIVLYLFLCYRHKVDPISDGIRLIASLDLHVSCGNIYVEQ